MILLRFYSPRCCPVCPKSWDLGGAACRLFLSGWIISTSFVRVAGAQLVIVLFVRWSWSLMSTLMELQKVLALWPIWFLSKVHGPSGVTALGVGKEGCFLC